MLRVLKKKDFFPLVTSFQALSIFKRIGDTGDKIFDTAKLSINHIQKLLHHLQ